MRLLSLGFLVSCLTVFAPACGDDDDGGGGGDAAASDDGGANTPDGGGGGSTDAPPAGDPDAAGGGGNGVACGDFVCTAPQQCCIDTSQQMQPPMCVAPGTCEGAVAECDGPEDCDGNDACCGSLGGPNGGGSASCMPLGDTCSVVLCHDVGDCDVGEMCCDTGFGASFCSSFCF